MAKQYSSSRKPDSLQKKMLEVGLRSLRLELGSVLTVQEAEMNKGKLQRVRGYCFRWTSMVGRWLGSAKMDTLLGVVSLCVIQ